MDQLQDTGDVRPCKNEYSRKRNIHKVLADSALEEQYKLCQSFEESLPQAMKDGKKYIFNFDASEMLGG